MTREHQDGWKTEVRQKCQDSEFNSLPRGMGTLPSSGSEIWNNSFRARRANSEKSNTLTIQSGAGNSGGIARQLIEETRKQLAYHKTQVSDLEARIQELEQFTEDLKTQDLGEDE